MLVKSVGGRFLAAKLEIFQLIKFINKFSHSFVLLLIGTFLQMIANKSHKNSKIFIKSVAYQENLNLS